MKIHGIYYPARSAKQTVATLDVDEQGNVAIYDTAAGVHVLERAAYGELDVSSRLGNSPRSITFATGARFETKDNDGVDAWQKSMGKQKAYRLIHVLESQKRYIVPSILFVMCFIYVGIRYGMPWGAEKLAHALPVETSSYLSQTTMDVLDEQFFSESELDPAVEKRLRTKFQPILDKYPDLNLQVEFRKGGDSIGANAFALPSGTMVFTDEIVALAENDEGLIAILGHEIGHVAHRHILRRAIQDSFLTLVIVAITGDATAASSLVSALPVLLVELAFSREFEHEADDFGLSVLDEEGISAHHFADIMQALMESQLAEAAEENQDEGDQSTEAASEETSDSENALKYFSTHPPTQDRVNRFRAHADTQE